MFQYHNLRQTGVWQMIAHGPNLASFVFMAYTLKAKNGCYIFKWLLYSTLSYISCHLSYISCYISIPNLASWSVKPEIFIIQLFTESSPTPELPTTWKSHWFLKHHICTTHYRLWCLAQPESLRPGKLTYRIQAPHGVSCLESRAVSTKCPLFEIRHRQQGRVKIRELLKF